MPYERRDGALINPPDFFLYFPEYATRPATVQLVMPPVWHAATALTPAASEGAPRFVAPNATTLLDSPILVGLFREWSFIVGPATYHVVYWPAAGAAAFDTAALVDRLRRLARAASTAFGPPPAHDYWFLLEDSAGDALEHAASLTIGAPSVALARDVGTYTIEIAHEFIHTWNLVAIRLRGYNDLSYRTGSHTPSLWIGEGVTMFYADALPRRAGIAEGVPSRLSHVAELLERYYGSPALLRVTPEAASLTFPDSPISNPDATGGYYLQGELLADVLDALVRDSTKGARGLDAIMRAMYARRRATSGYTPQEFEAVAGSVCRCRLDAFFAREVRGTGPIDLTPLLLRLGLHLVVDSVTAVDDSGRPRPDRRLVVAFGSSPPLVVVIHDPSTAWARAGLRTGDTLVAINGIAIASFAQLQSVLAAIRLDGDSAAIATVDLTRDGRPVHLQARVTGYRTPRVRFVDARAVTAEQRWARRAWLAGH